MMSPTLYYNRGNVRAAMGRHSGAVEDFDLALQNGDVPKMDTLYNRGNSKFALEMFKEAHEDFEAVWLEQKVSYAALAMGNCKVKMGAFEEALRPYMDGGVVGPEDSAAHCRENAARIQELLYFLGGHDFSVNHVEGNVFVWTERAAGLFPSFPIGGNRGNTGNRPSGMVRAPGGEGYEGADGFAVRIVPPSR